MNINRSERLLMAGFLTALLLSPDAWGYEAPEDKQDVFSGQACPAFLTFRNAAYLAGVTVELPCHCKPQEVHSVVWFFRKHDARAEDTRALRDYHGNRLLDTSQVLHSADLQSRFSIRLFSLFVFRAGLLDSGLYICGSAHRDFFFGYDLDIQEARKLSFSPSLANLRMESQEGGEMPGPPHALYQVFTGYEPWTVCDRCGPPGEQVRIGLCYVRSRFLHVRYRRANQTVASCGSGGVPKAFGDLKDRTGGPSMEVRSCQVACPSETPPSSNLLSLMAFLGRSSATLQVYYLNHQADHVLTLGCPGARPNMAVAWDLGPEPMYRSALSAAGSTARLLIDTGHHLVFRPATTQDSGTYYCWLQGQKAAEIRLLVYPNFGSGQSPLDHPEFPDALWTVFTSYSIMTALFCLLLFCRALFRYHRDTERTHED